MLKNSDLKSPYACVLQEGRRRVVVVDGQSEMTGGTDRWTEHETVDWGGKQRSGSVTVIRDFKRERKKEEKKKEKRKRKEKERRKSKGLFI